jgi:hypothetical protein
LRITISSRAISRSPKPGSPKGVWTGAGLPLWKRYVTTPKGAWFDTPTPNSLAHFTPYPALLDESGDFCYLCSAQKKLSMAMAATEPKAQVNEVGNIDGLTIYDIF